MTFGNEHAAFAALDADRPIPPWPPLHKGGGERGLARGRCCAFVGWAPPTVTGRGGFRVGGRSLRLCKVGVDGVEKSIARGAFLLRKGGCRRLPFPPL